MNAKINPQVARAYIRKNNGVLSVKKMAADLGVSESYVSLLRTAMGIKTIRVCAADSSGVNASYRQVIGEAMNGTRSLLLLRQPWTLEGISHV